MDLGVRVCDFIMFRSCFFIIKSDYGLGKVLLSRNFGKVCG